LTGHGQSSDFSRIPIYQKWGIAQQKIIQIPVLFPSTTGVPEKKPVFPVFTPDCEHKIESYLFLQFGKMCFRDS